MPFPCRYIHNSCLALCFTPVSVLLRPLLHLCLLPLAGPFTSFPGTRTAPLTQLFPCSLFYPSFSPSPPLASPLPSSSRCPLQPLPRYSPAPPAAPRSSQIKRGAGDNFSCRFNIETPHNGGSGCDILAAAARRSRGCVRRAENLYLVFLGDLFHTTLTYEAQ